MKPKLLIFILIFLISKNTFSQESESVRNYKNIILADINVLGEAGIYFEKRIVKLKRVSYFLHIGGKTLFDAPHFFGFEFGAFGLTGMKKSHFEYGLNFCSFEFLTRGTSRNYILYQKQAIIGYRYQNFNKKGIVVKGGLALTHLTIWNDDYSSTEFYPLPYFGIGYAF